MNPPAASLFTSFHDATHRKAPAWAAPLLGACTLVTGALVFAMWVKAIWTTERLEPPRLAMDLAIAPAPPPPPPPPAGGEKPRDVVITPRRITVKSLVQPVRIEHPDPRPQSTEVGDPDGKEGGKEGGVPDGEITGALDSPTPPPIQAPTPPVVVPKIVLPSALEASRIAGEKQIVPDDVTKIEIQRAGKDSLVGVYKVCVGTAGEVTSVSVMKPTGFAAYDTRIASTIRGSWRYRPFLIEGKPAPVCTAVRFEYSQ